MTLNLFVCMMLFNTKCLLYKIITRYKLYQNIGHVALCVNAVGNDLLFEAHNVLFIGSITLDYSSGKQSMESSKTNESHNVYY